MLIWTFTAKFVLFPRLKEKLLLCLALVSHTHASTFRSHLVLSFREKGTGVVPLFC